MATELLKRISAFLARLPGLPILAAIVLVIMNFVVRLLPDWQVVAWLSHTDLLLHLGVALGLLGVMLARVL